MHSALRAIAYHLPEHTLSSAGLSAEFPDWSVERIDSKTGIHARHIAAPDECASDLAVAAARKLFATGVVAPEDIDFVLFCTQSPDYFLPTTACLLQDRLGIPTTAGALDFNLGCSGYVYGLGLVEGLIASGQARSVLLLTGETYSKYMHPGDRSVRTIFGDAASATWLTSNEAASFGPFVYGTDGSGGQHLIVPAGGMRARLDEAAAIATTDSQGNVRSPSNLFMDGREVFSFTLTAVPQSVNGVLEKAGLSLDDIDLFVFHQANRFMLDHLRKQLHIPAEKFFLAFEHCGNTVSSTIPIALNHAALAGRLPQGAVVMLVGFGVGLSWAATIYRVTALVTTPAADPSWA